MSIQVALPSVIWVELIAKESPFVRVLDELQSQRRVREFVSIKNAIEQSRGEQAIVAVSREGVVSLGDIETLTEKSESLCLLLADWCCGWKRRLPSDLSYEIRYLHEIKDGFALGQLFGANVSPQDVPAKLVAIYARSRSYCEALQTLVQQTNSPSIGLRFGDGIVATGVDLVLWEASPWQPERREELEALRNRHPNARVIALLTFPREFEITELKQQGVTVLPQPISNAELLCHVAQANESEQRLKLTA